MPCECSRVARAAQCEQEDDERARDEHHERCAGEHDALGQATAHSALGL